MRHRYCSDLICLDVIMRAAAIVGCLLSTNVEAVEPGQEIAQLQEIIAAHPNDNESASRLGQLLGLQGHAAEAERLINGAIKHEPENPDHFLRLAIVLRHAKRYEEALIAAEKACVLAPNYADALSVRQAIRDAIANPPEAETRWRFFIHFSGDDYSARRDRESELATSIAYEFRPQLSLVAGFNQQHRFGFDDQRYDLSLYGALGDIGSAWARIGISPDNDFLADHEEEAAGEISLFSDWLLGARLVHRSFPNEQLFMPRPSLRWNATKSVALEVSYLWTLSDQQSTTTSTEARVHWTASDNVSGSIGYSFGEENNPPLPVGQVSTLSASIIWQLNNRLGLRLDASHEDREGLYERNGIGAGAMVKF